jgi:hypothetical protein
VFRNDPNGDTLVALKRGNRTKHAVLGPEMPAFEAKCTRTRSMRAEIVNKSKTNFWKARSLPALNRLGAETLSGALYEAILVENSRCLEGLEIGMFLLSLETTVRCSLSLGQRP